jgi:hypothetical protein
MKPVFSAHLQRRAALVVLLAGMHSAGAQTWIQWSSAAGGNNHYYAVTPFATNWDAAEKLAVSWGGTLATITSSNEQNFINVTFLTGVFEHRPIWIGLIDSGKNTPLRRLEERFGLHPEANFGWVTGERLSYTNWKEGEPNDYGGKEYCGTINWEYSDNLPRGTKGDWNDAPLDGTRGFGGTTDGPYFGLVERDTDPSRPQPRSFMANAPGLGLMAILIIVLIILLTRFRRQKNQSHAMG